VRTAAAIYTDLAADPCEKNSIVIDSTLSPHHSTVKTPEIRYLRTNNSAFKQKIARKN